MSAWWIGSKIEDAQHIHDALDVMKCNPVEADDHGKETVIAFFKAHGRWNEEINGVLPLDAIRFDGGGAIRNEEPWVGWEANGCKMKTRVTHLPFTLEVFRNSKLDKKLPGCVTFGGFCRSYVIAHKTVQDSIEVMERLLRGTESLRQELEMDFQKTFNEIPRAASVRRCGCLSGLQYADCCGKFIESAGHKELRKAIE